MNNITGWNIPSGQPIEVSATSSELYSVPSDPLLIQVTVRSDSSGTTEIFKKSLASFETAFSDQA